MKPLKNTITLIFAFLSMAAIGQDYSIIHIEGDAFAHKQVDGKEKYSKLVYGPLVNCEKIVVKDNAVVKVLGENKKVSILDEEGEYLLSELMFKSVKENSIFDKFCDYFHAFFVHHNSSESKANYKNNIYAISRGNVAPPSLDFPLEGSLPMDAGALHFIWTHDCEACEYIFNVYDYDSRALIYTTMTEEKMVSIDKPMKYFKEAKEYYWTVNIVGEDLNYEVIPFTISKSNDYRNKINHIEKELEQNSNSYTPTAQAVYVMSTLGYDQINYAIHYGLSQIDEHPDDEQLSNIIERFWYDALMQD